MPINPHAHTEAPSWRVWGHEWAVTLLQRALSPTDDSHSARGPRHAYLFTGPRHVGKTTLATAFAQTLLCVRGTSVACGACRPCRLVSHGNYADFRLIQPLNKEGNPDRINGMLRAEQAVDLVREVALRPVEGRYKIFLLQDVQLANDSFSNKVLKTLEEPAAHVILLLTADDRNNLLPTTVSRCQVLPLRPLDRATVRQALVEQWHIPADKADLLARLANGRLGWAVREAEQSAFLTGRSEALMTLNSLIQASRLERLAFSEELAGQRNDASIFGLLELWTGWWRDVMLVQTGCADACLNIDQWDALQHQAQQIAPVAVRGYLELLRQLDGYLHHTVNTRLALDVLLLQLPRLPAART